MAPPRKRSVQNRNLPENLYPNGKYWRYRNPITGVITSINKSQAEAIKSFRIVPADFTEASGHLTPSMKVKRAQVMKDFETVIEEMYAAPRS